MIYKASKGQNRGRSYIISSAPGNAVLSVHKTHYDKHDLYSSTGEIGQLHPSPEIFSLKPLHLRSCPMKRRYCMPLSCAGRSCPARTAGQTRTGAFTCTIQSARESPCSTVGGRKPSTTCVRELQYAGLVEIQKQGCGKPNRIYPKSYEAVPNTDFKKSGYGTPED